MQYFILGMTLLWSGCAPLLLTEQRMVKVETEVQELHTDFRTLATTFTPEQHKKYARAKLTQDDATFQEFYTSLDMQQQATMQTLLTRAEQVEQERQRIEQSVRQDLARRRDLVRRTGIRGIMMAGGVGI